MKRYIAFFLVFISFACFNAPAFAENSDGKISIAVPEGEILLSKNTADEFSYTIYNSGSVMGAKEFLYVDDILVSNPNPNYFMVFGKTYRKISFTVPNEVIASMPHTLKIKVCMKDGTVYEKITPFCLASPAPSIEMNFMVYSQSVDVGGTFSCGVQFWFPDASLKYGITTAISLNGTRLAEFDESHTLTSGEIRYFNIPGSYATDDMLSYNFKLTANPDPTEGEGTKSISVEVPLNGDKAKQAAQVASLVNPVIITAYVTRTTSGYAYANLSGYQTTIPEGSYVAYLNPDNHNSMRAAKVRTSWGGVYWVKMSDIYITTGNYVIADNLSPQQKELFVNYKGYDSKTPYLIWVNLERQILTVFMGSKGNWQYLAHFPVASGKNNTPTPTVEHEIQYVTRWVTPSYTCYPVLALYDGYAIHNQPVSPRGYVLDSTIGRPASAGCVRMLQKDINWVHSVVPVKTNVVIY